MKMELLEGTRKLLTPETIKAAAQQSKKLLLIPRRLQKAIQNFIQEQEKQDMKKKVLRLSEAMKEFNNVGMQLDSADGHEALRDLYEAHERSRRWKIKSSYADASIKYTEDETVAYVAARMPAVYSSAQRVLREVSRRLPDFCPARVLDYGSGPGSVLWALREIWSRSLKNVNLVEPSRAMAYASRSLLRDVKGLPIICSYESIQELARNVDKNERGHDLVIASYVLGEIPSPRERITIARQLWGLTQDVLVLIEPGTPQGSTIVREIRSHILWMEKKKCRKVNAMSKEAAKAQESTVDVPLPYETGAFVVAPCAHDGVCPLGKTGNYCHFVQRLERTHSQRIYKFHYTRLNYCHLEYIKEWFSSSWNSSKSSSSNDQAHPFEEDRMKGEPLRGYEDEKFSFVVLRRGKRPKSCWPLDGMKFDTLKEQQQKRKPEDMCIDYEDQFESEPDNVGSEDALGGGSEISDNTESEDVYEEEEEGPVADVGSGWGRIIFSPVRRGKRITLDVCRSTKRDGSEGSFERVVVAKSKNPTLHHQARRSLWGDLWPF